MTLVSPHGFAASTNSAFRESGDTDTHRSQNGHVTITDQDAAVVLHESAHCVVASRLGLHVARIELVWENGALNGYSHIRQGSKLADWLTVRLAGEVAEVEVFGEFKLSRHHQGSDREGLYLDVVKAGRAGEQALFVARQKVARAVHVHRGSIIQMAHDLLALVAQAQGSDVTVEADDLSRMMGDDVAVLRLAANDDQTRLLAATDVASLKRAMNG
jgi:hypothetical protein